MNKLSILAILFGVLAVILSIMVGVKAYFIHRDTGTWLNRAQIAAQADDMLYYLKQADTGLSKWQYENGYAAIIFKTPWNNADMDRKAISQAINRVETINSMNRSSMEYQAGMDDVRGLIREIRIAPEYFYFIHSQFTAVFIGMIVSWLTLAGIAIGAMILY